MKAIMYHYVRKYNEKLPFFKFLSASNFSKQLDFFQQEYGFVTKDEFNNFIKIGSMPDQKGKILLTFDDGFSDHYEYVFTELKNRNLWGIFFVPTMPFIEKCILEVHKIHLMCGQYKGEDLFKFLNKIISNEMLSKKYINDFDEKIYLAQSNSEFTANFKKILNYFINDEYKSDIINQITSKFNINTTYDDFYLNADQIKEMSSGGMLFGSHTYSHKLLSTLDIKSQKYEIEESIKYMETILNLDHRLFCFPYGGFHSFNNKTISVLKELDFSCSFNVESRDINKNDFDLSLFHLPRYDCNEFKYGKVS